MKYLILTIGLLGLCVCGFPPKAQAENADQHVANQVLVKFAQSVSDEEKKALRLSLGATLLERIQSIRLEQWTVPKAIDLETAVTELNVSPLVEYAEPNFLYQPHALPDDPHFSKLWHLQNTGQTLNGQSGIPGADVNVVPAWDLQSGSAEVVIAVVDSGVAFDHPDLTDNAWVNQGEIPDNGLDDDGNGYIDDIHGWDFVNNDNNPSDYSRDLYGDGHGTHVAGIIGARGNNALGSTGLLWKCRIMPLQIFDLFQSNTFAAHIIQIIRIIQALDYAVQNGARIINCSFGGSAFSQALYDMYALANEQDVLVVAAAGNNNNDNDQTPIYPASYDLPNIIAVAATNEQDALAVYSNYGAQSVDLAAPGGSSYKSNIFSTIPPERVVLFQDDFENGLTQWTTSSQYNDWLVDYDFLFDSQVLQSSTTYYHNNESATVTTAAPIDGLLARGLHLHMDIEYHLENGFDYLYIEGSQDGTTFTPAYVATGHSGGIIHFNDWKSELALGTFYLRFRLETDANITDLGVFVDNLKLTGVRWEFDGDEYGTKSGTSMAAPVVTGLAGLLWSSRPELSALEIKNTLLETVDTLEGLSGKVKSNGRANALKALSALHSQTMHLDFHQGWNLAGMSLVPGENGVDTLFSPLAESIHSIWSWKDGLWAVSLPAQSEQEASAYIQEKGFQALETINLGDGFWVNAQTNATLTVNGSLPSTTVPNTHPGWNLLSLPGDSVQTASEVVQACAGSVFSLWKWEKNNWTVFLPGQEDKGLAYAQSKGFGLIQTIEPGQGIWVNCQ